VISAERMRRAKLGFVRRRGNKERGPRQVKVEWNRGGGERGGQLKNETGRARNCGPLKENAAGDHRNPLIDRGD